MTAAPAKFPTHYLLTLCLIFAQAAQAYTLPWLPLYGKASKKGAASPKFLQGTAAENKTEVAGLIQKFVPNLEDLLHPWGSMKFHAAEAEFVSALEDWESQLCLADSFTFSAKDKSLQRL